MYVALPMRMGASWLMACVLWQQIKLNLASDVKFKGQVWPVMILFRVEPLLMYMVNYVQLMSQLCPAYVPILSSLCPNFVLLMSQFCPAYVPIMSSLCPNYVPIVECKYQKMYIHIISAVMS